MAEGCLLIVSLLQKSLLPHNSLLCARILAEPRSELGDVLMIYPCFGICQMIINIA
jgi:hypothetical protein